MCSSPYRRCLQTVAPVAAALGVEVEERSELAIGAGLRALDLVRSAGAGAVLCTHGDVVFDVLAVLRGQGVVSTSALDKASTWVLELDGERVVAATYLPAPPA